MADKPLRNVLDHLRRTAAAEEARGATDAQLLERFAVRHDQDAFELLVWRHSRMVLGVCRRLLRDDHDAEDAFQASFLLLAKKAARIRRREAVGGWLYRVAYRVALQARAGAAKRAAREQSLDGVPVPSVESDPSVEAAGRELRQALDEEIDHLPKKYRSVIVLRCLAGKSGEETAQELGCPVGTVESRLTRAREKLRARLNRKGFAVPSAAIVAGLSGEAMAVNVSEQWVNEVVKNAALVAAGRAMAGAISPKTVVLMEGVLRAMLLSKARTFTAALLVLSLSALACVVLAKGQVKSEGEKAQAENKKEANRPANDPPAEDDRIRPGDVLQIEAAEVLPDAPIKGHYRVERRGTIALGLAYGRVQVKGQTLEEAEATILRYLQKNVVEKVSAVMVTRYDPVTGLTLERRIELLETEVAALREAVKKLRR